MSDARAPIEPSRFGVAARLPLSVDVSALAADLDGLPAGAFIPHFNTRIYEGDWSGAALRAPGGDGSRLYPDLATRAPMQDTPWLARCPGARALLDALGCPLLAVRFLRLGPGARIKPHRDYDLGFAFGEVRLHVPVRTRDDVSFVVGDVPIPMRPGELWYADFDRIHHVHNPGPTDRVHLVIDCVVDAWLLACLERATCVLQSPSSAS